MKKLSGFAYLASGALTIATIACPGIAQQLEAPLRAPSDVSLSAGTNWRPRPLNFQSDPGIGESSTAENWRHLNWAFLAADGASGQAPWEGQRHQHLFSRIGIGADVSPLGIGIKSATPLNDDFDVRLMGNFFNYNTGKFELEGFRVNAQLHLASLGTALDFYPHNSIWRLSAGLMFYNGNQLSAVSDIVPGTSFTLDGKTYYSATANPVTGATPLAGSGALGMNRNKPEFTLSGGFGRFVPHSGRHWSFPSEFGAIFMGAPTVDVNLSGWACLDAKQTQCSNIGDPTNPVAIQFNDSLQKTLTKWRNDLSSWKIYPIFSYSVVYSFDIR
ncbi:MAG: hypothetical protein ACLGSD_17985 [Acidobacteriota bacterium]